MVIKKNCSKQEKVLPKPDIYRDTGLRYLGYVGSLGWICRAFLPFQVASMVSVAYVCADIFDKANESANCGNSEKKVIVKAADAFTWHFLASFAIPTAFVQGINGLSTKLINRRTENRSRVLMLPCLICGFALPFISKPIDNMVDNLMYSFLRHRSPNDDSEECECTQVIVKQCIDKPDGQTSNNDDDNNKGDEKYNWFFEQSRDQHDLELERYREKLKSERSQDPSSNRIRQDTNQFDQRRFGKESMAANQREANAKRDPTSADASGTQALSEPFGDEDDDENGMHSRAVQVDKTTKPPKPKPQE